MRKCTICGKPYIDNPNLNKLPKILQEKLQIIPQCDCEYKASLEARENLLMEKWNEDRQEMLQKRIKKYRDISVQDKKFFESTFDNSDNTEYTSMCVKYAKNFLIKENAPGLMLFGKVGTGKTHLAACISNYLMKANKSVMVMNVSKYLSKLRQDWSEAERDVLKHIENVDLLVIDDLGVENMTKWTYEKIFNLIDTRYRSQKPCIITTNLTQDEISEKFSDGMRNDRIGDRIKEMCYPINIKGVSRRKIERDVLKEFLN